MNYKIYKIVDNSNGNIYIGQTSQDIKRRIAEHNYHFRNNDKYRYCSSYQILANGDWSYEIVQDLLTKQVADDLEKYYIKNTPNCINRYKLNFNQKKYTIDYNKNNKEKASDYYRKKRNYENSFGGDKRYDNNLLLIDVKSIFN